MQKVYIVSAKRTAIGTFAGTLAKTSALELGTALVKGLLSDSNIKPEDVNEVILGNVLSSGLGQNITRQIALKAGIPQEVPSFSVNKVCGSGMKSLALAYQSIAMGESDVVIAGGVENMNLSPYLLKGAREGLKLGNADIEDSIIKDGLWCALNDYHMGITAENLAEKYSISREEQDEYAALSHQKASKALSEKAFEEEIVAVPVRKRKTTEDFLIDEHIRPETTSEKLANLRPAFKKDGSVTAGNASGINDGAAGLILAGENYIKSKGITPLAEVTGFASAGVDPSIMGIGPVAAINKLVSKTGLNLDDVELFELNEAFAVQSLAVLKELKINPELVNVNGGAIALGHPIGASGARIVVTLIHAMKKRGLKTGLASLCIGGGMGIAMSLNLDI